MDFYGRVRIFTYEPFAFMNAMAYCENEVFLFVGNILDKVFKKK